MEQRKFGEGDTDDYDAYTSEECQAWNRMADEEELKEDAVEMRYPIDENED